MGYWWSFRSRLPEWPGWEWRPWRQPSIPVACESGVVKPTEVGTGEGVTGEFDVFLNHRGPDTKKSFVAHLNEALRKAGCKPFLDVESLIEGKHAFESIDKALTGVRVHVAIFSKGYAQSKYCLNELCDMLDSNKPIIPVYYHGVEPENLRRPEAGPYASAFDRHLQKGRQEDVKRWKTALLEAAKITGFRLAAVNGDEAKLTRRVASAVLNALPNQRRLQISHAVGVEKPSKDIIDLLNLMGDNSVGVVGVVGMGGIGKTTIAKGVFDHFVEGKGIRCRSFLDNVRESDVSRLQAKMVQDLLHVDINKGRGFDSCFEEISLQKCLIIVDDIDNRRQFDDLIPCLEKLAPGSRVLVTSRNKNLLNLVMQRSRNVSHQVKNASYAVQELGPSESLELFRWHAFGNKGPSDGFSELTTEVVNACGGLPLALEVIGGFLSDKKNEKCWRQAAASLQGNGDIISRLMISYDGLLEPEDKKMFLDIACFLIGYREYFAMEIWNSDGELYKAPEVSLGRLMDKSLVKVDAEGRLSMHDLLRDMGRHVVENQSSIRGEHSHLWNPLTASNVLEKNQGTNKVAALSVAGVESYAACEAERYKSMSELRFLILDGCPVLGDFSKWSTELRWLQWRFLTQPELPSNLKLLRLAVLDVSNSKFLTRIWPQEVELELHCRNLRVLILSNCLALEELPKHIDKLSGLKLLDVRGCRSLRTLPDSVGNLKDLEQLLLSECSSLRKLPQTVVNLSSLKELRLDNCTKLKKLPVTFGKLESLVVFGAEQTSLNLLPSSFSQLSNLECLLLSRSENLRKLPSSMSGLKKLKVLHLNETGLEELPGDFGYLQSLTELEIDACANLRALPDSFGCLERLQILSLKDNFDLILPESFGRLKALVDVDLDNCGLKHLSHSSFSASLSALTTLRLQRNCMSSIPESFEYLHGLRTLEMFDCWLLTVVQALPKSLRRLNFNDCPELREIPSLEHLSLLRFLKLRNCRRLPEVQGLGALTSLEYVNLSGCTMLRTTQSVKSNRALRRCKLSGSHVNIAYDSKWLESKPDHQVISYYDNSLRFVGNGMAQEITGAWNASPSTTLSMEIDITESGPCIAVIFFFLGHDQGGVDFHNKPGLFYCFNDAHMEARIVRNDVEIHTTSLCGMRENDINDQVSVCTLRILHPFVRAVRPGDKIRVYSSVQTTLKEAAVCLVHKVGERAVVVVNGDTEAGEALKEKLDTQLLGDKVLLNHQRLLSNDDVAPSVGYDGYAPEGDFEQEVSTGMDSMPEDGVGIGNYRGQFENDDAEFENDGGQLCGYYGAGLYENDGGQSGRKYKEPMVPEHDCDICGCQIWIKRWHCSVCEDFDVCEACHSEPDADKLPSHHKLDHHMFAFPSGRRFHRGRSVDTLLNRMGFQLHTNNSGSQELRRTLSWPLMDQADLELDPDGVGGRDSPQSTTFPGDSPPFSSRESDAAEAERRTIKQAAKDHKRKEKASETESQDQEKAAWREEKRPRQ